MAINEKTPKIPESKSQQEKQAKRLEALVTETEILANAFEQIAKNEVLPPKTKSARIFR